MARAYTDMREANWKHSDKYFHARVNRDAAQRGPGGAWAAKVIRYLMCLGFWIRVGDICVIQQGEISLDSQMVTPLFKEWIFLTTIWAGYVKTEPILEFRSPYSCVSWVDTTYLILAPISSHYSVERSWCFYPSTSQSSEQWTEHSRGKRSNGFYIHASSEMVLTSLDLCDTGVISKYPINM